MKQSSSFNLGIAARNAVLKVTAFWVLLVAAYLAIGRQFFPYIEHLTPEVEVWLSDQLGTNVDIGQLRGDWVRFNPVIYLEDVHLGDRLSIKSMTLAPGIYESIARGGLSFNRFEVSDFQAEAVQTDNGWQITGLASQSSDKVSINLDAILALIRRQQAVVFSNVTLDIKPKNLPPFTLDMQQGRLTRYGQENGLFANAFLKANDYQVPIELQFESTDNALGVNRIYFQHGDIDLSPWMANLIPNLSEAVIAGEYWIELNGGDWSSATIRQSLRSMTLNGKANNLDLRDGKVELFLSPSQSGFTAALNLLGYQLNSEEFGSTQASIQYDEQQLSLQWDSLPAPWIKHSLALDDQSGFWLGLSPAGFVEQGQLSVDINAPESLTLSALLSDISLQSHQSVPGLSHLNGRLQMENNRGQMSVSADDSDFILSGVFHEAYSAQIRRATLSWLMMPGEGTFAEGTGDVVLQPPPDHANQGTLPVQVFWHSDSASRAAKQKGRESTLGLQLNIESANRYWTTVMASTKPVGSNTSALIADRLEAGDFKNLQLDYLRYVDANRDGQQQFFISADFDQVDVSFLDGWQSATGMRGKVYLDQDGLSITASSGQYPGLAVDQLNFSLPFDERVIAIQVQGKSDVPRILNFLTSGPLRTFYGDQFDEWVGSGEAAVSIGLSVPLSSPTDFSVQVDTQLAAATLDLPPYDLMLSEINGEIHYNRQQGVYGQGIEFSHLGLPQTLALSSDMQKLQPTFTFDVDGQTPISYWGKRLNDVYAAQLDAIVDMHATVKASSQSVQIMAQSDLTAVALDLPAPLGKPLGESLPLQLSVTFDQKNWRAIRTTFGDALQSYVELNQNNQLQRATIAYGTPLNVRQENGIYIDAVVDSIDGDDWWESIQAFRELYAEESTSGQNLDSLFRAVHVEANNLNYLAQPWTKADVTILRNDEAWLVSFNSDEGQGQVLVPRDDGPIFTELQWVSLTTGDTDTPFDEQVDPLLSYLPGNVPNMQIIINKLIWNGRDFGDWQMTLNSLDDRLDVDDISGHFGASTFTGALQWLSVDGQHETSLTGALVVQNVADVISTLQYPPVLTSRSGQVDVKAAWNGSPAFFDFKRIKGQLLLTLNKGAIKTDEEYEGVKLIGLLNFTRVLQRIALDFSDLMESGITYDEISGELLFDRGFARVGEQLLIDGSAIKFRFSGDADLLLNSLDVDMVITVPLSTTFPLVALLAGVSPQAAAAIYVTERVLSNGLERISSARMHITGSFEDPQTKFYRVLDTDSDNQDSSISTPNADKKPEGALTQ